MKLVLKYCILFACIFSCAHAGNSLSRNKKDSALLIREAAPVREISPLPAYLDLAREISTIPYNEVVLDERIKGLNELFSHGFSRSHRGIMNLVTLINECRHLPPGMLHDLWNDAIQGGKQSPWLCLFTETQYRHDFHKKESWDLISESKIDEALWACASTEQSYPDNASIGALKGHLLEQKQLFVSARQAKFDRVHGILKQYEQ